MNATDQRKLIKAGFIIIRAEGIRAEGLFDKGNELKIKYKGDGSYEWKTLEKGFINKASLKRRMKQLLEGEKIIED